MRAVLSATLLLGCTAEITAPQPDDGAASADDTGDTSPLPDTGDTDEADAGDTGAADSEDSGEEDLEPVDYRAAGPYPVDQRSQTISASCSMQTWIYTPQGIAAAPLVVLAHGFARTPEQVIGWAEHLASWGLTVAVPQLCHSSFFDADHETNGADLLAIPDALGADAVVYAGHSAGGLSAFIAASLDPDALGVVGLDATDSDGIGLSYAAGLSVPALGMLGEPSDCNADCNGFDLYDAAPDAVAVRITDADHCDYESDTDWMCTTFCNNTTATFSDDNIQSTIRGLTTAAVFEITEGETGWWLEGTFYSALLSEGQISAL